MPFVPAVDTVKVDVTGLLHSQQVDNTLWFRFRTGEPTITDMLALGDAINTFVPDNFLPGQSRDYHYIGCIVTGQWSLSAPAVNVPVIAVPGGLTEDGEPGSVAFVITFLTGARGRSSRGRNYIAGLGKGVVLGNQLDVDNANTLLLGYQAILGSPFDADWEWSVVSHKTGGLDRVTALIEPIIGARYADLFVDAQRRRLTGRGT